MPSNFDPSIQNLLAAAPFFDDWDATKNYYRVLFRPAAAVQARELNQQQTILQNQISEFASTVYKNGSVVEGCSIEYIPDLEWVALSDYFSTSSDLAQNDPSLTNAVVVGNTSGVQAYVVATQAGFASQEPGKFFIRYTAPGANGISKFIPGEYLNVYGSDSSYVEDIVITANSSVSGFVGSEGQVVQCVQTGNSSNVLATAVVMSVNTSANTITVNNIKDFFQTGESLIIMNTPTTNTGISSFKYDTGALIGSINVLCSGSNPYILPPANGVMTTNAAFTNADSTGYAYGAYISEGVVYQSGFFVDVKPQTIVVNPSSASPANYSLGFTTKATIVTQDIDPSLNDNALGYPNYNAPGAYRLQLTANLVSVAANSISSSNNFFPIVQFSNSGAVFENIDPSYSTLGDALAERTYEEAGHFVVEPFLVSSNTDVTSTDNVVLTIQPGLAYVEGERIQTLSSVDIKERRGTDTQSADDVVVTTTYGNYIQVNQLVGFFQQSFSVNLYDTAQQAVSTGKVISSSASGNSIGTATLRAIVSDQSLQGTPNSTYNAYLFDIKMSNSAVSFANVKSIVLTGTSNAFADVSGNSAVLYDSAFTPMVFSIGSGATKTLANANGASDSSYYFLASSNTSLATTGRISFSVPVSGQELGFGVGPASTQQMQYVTVTMLSNTASANIATNAVTYANGVITCSSPAIGTSIFYAGDVVGTTSGNWLVQSVINSTALQTTCTVANAAAAIWRIEQAGRVVPLDGVTRTLMFSNSTSGYANLGLTYQSSANAEVTFYALESSATPILKKINRQTTVLIQPNNSGTDKGPWSLGLPDVLSVKNIYRVDVVGGGYTPDLSNNVISDFVVNNGQKDGYYDLGSISLSPRANVASYANQMLVALVDHFTPNNASGLGFFSIDSYPIDDSYTANSEVTINTADVPIYKSSTQGIVYNLRDSIDFRPYKTATASIGNDIAAATVNPSSVSGYDSRTLGQTPFPSGNFICNVTHYLGRKDVLLLSSSGSFNIAEGVASLNPRSPLYDANTNLAIASINVPPYPSLSSDEQSNYPNAPSSYDLTITLQNHRRYTMNDISGLDQRISQLEYYTTLNTLENAALSTSTVSGNGQQQFKNGVFVDPLSSFSFARTELPQFRMAIDTENSYGRPYFIPSFVQLDYDQSNSNNVQQTGDSLSLSYTSVPYLNQNFSTDSRFLSGLPPSFTGNMSLYPNFWSEIEPLGPAASVSSAGSPSTTALAQMAGPQFCADFGWWRQSITASLSSAINSEASSLRGATIISGNMTSPTSYSINDVTYVDVSVQAYLASREIAMITTGLKPYTVFNIYIDGVQADQWTAPGVVNVSGDKTSDNMVTRTAPAGSVLRSDSRGQLAAKISLPALYFVAGQHVVTIVDVSSDYVTGQPVSGAAGVFIANIVYKVPPAPPPPLPPPPPPMPPVGPMSLFKLTSGVGSLSVSSPSYPALTFVDVSVAGNNSIVSWVWNFGDGTTQTLSSAKQTVSHTYNQMLTNTQDINVSLTVTDLIGKTATSVQVFRLVRSVPAIQLPSVNAHASIIAATPGSLISGTHYNLTSVVSDAVTSTGNCAVVFQAATSNTVAGAYWTWAISNTSGAATTQTVIAGSDGSNSQYYVLLAGNTSSNQTATFTVTATYNDGEPVLPAANSRMTLNSTVVIRPRGGATDVGDWNDIGCVDINSYTPTGALIGEYAEGDIIQVCRHKDLSIFDRRVSRAFRSLQPCHRLVLTSGASIIVSDSTPLEGRDGKRFLPVESLNEQLPVMDKRNKDNIMVFWDTIVEVTWAGYHEVNRISISGQDLCYWAGEQKDLYISVHNVAMSYAGNRRYWKM